MASNTHPRPADAPHGMQARIALAAGVGSILPVLAFLTAGPGHAAETLSATMPVSTAELATPEGRRATEARMAVIAARLCRQFRDTRTVAYRETYVECTRDTMAAARAKIDTAVAAAGHANGTPAPAASATESDTRVAGN